MVLTNSSGASHEEAVGMNIKATEFRAGDWGTPD